MTQRDRNAAKRARRARRGKAQRPRGIRQHIAGPARRLVREEAAP